MGYSLWLEDKKTGEVCQGKTRCDIGNMTCPNGTNNLEFNITYNYAGYYYEVFEEEGIRKIYGMTGGDSLPFLSLLCASIKNKYYNTEEGRWKVLLKPINKLVLDDEVITPERALKLAEDNKEKAKRIENKEVVVLWNEGDTSDYWKPTAANAIKAVRRLIEMAEECPEGVWNGD